MASSFVQWSRFVRSPNDIIRRLLFGPKLAMAGIGLQNGARRRNRQRPPPHGAEDTALRVFSRRRQITQLRRLFFARRFILSHSISHWKRRFAVAPPEPGYSGLIHYSIFQFPDPIAARIKRRVRSWGPGNPIHSSLFSFRSGSGSGNRKIAFDRLLLVQPRTRCGLVFIFPDGRAHKLQSCL